MADPLTFGGGAAIGKVVGAAAGTVVAGPVGTVVGGGIGAIVGGVATSLASLFIISKVANAATGNKK